MALPALGIGGSLTGSERRTMCDVAWIKPRVRIDWIWQTQGLKMMPFFAFHALKYRVRDAQAKSTHSSAG